LFICADGEADKAWGNETIRWHPEERWLELKLPPSLSHLANRPYGRRRLSCPVAFSHRSDEVAAQSTSGAVRYDICYESGRRRWYLDASWRLPGAPTPPIEELRDKGVLGVDLNAGHLAAVVVDRSGNPVGTPATIPLELSSLPAPPGTAVCGQPSHSCLQQPPMPAVPPSPSRTSTSPGRGPRAVSIPQPVPPGEEGTALQGTGGRHPDGTLPGPPGADGGQPRDLRDRRRPRLHLPMGSGALAGRGSISFSRGRRAPLRRPGHRTTWARAASTATGRV
jgi:hypothetical protein